MLRLTTRRALYSARPLHAVPANTCTRGQPLALLTLRSFSSTLLGGTTASSESLASVTKETTTGRTIRQRKAAWEQKILVALHTYKKLHGHLIVPRPFAVPDGDEQWPSVTWGYNLGTAVNRLRTKLENKSPLSTEMKEELEKLGFVRNVAQYKWDNIVLPALQRFYQEYKHTDVPREFVVPTDDKTWPRLAWGYALGSMAEGIRQKASYTAQVAMSKEELDRIEFCHEMALVDRDWNEKILPSLRIYRQEFGNCIIPRSFVVPSSDPWPEKAWGKALGKVVNACRTNTSYVEHTTRDRPVLDTLGFAWNRNAAVWNEIIFSALETYVDLFKNARVPWSFVVPSEAPWPEKTWGERLGRKLADMRRKGAFFLQYGRDIDKLDELGLNVKLSPRAWQARVAPLLSTYAEIHGDEEVSHDFVIPSEDPWEQKLWGVRLGLIVARNSQFLPRKC